MFYLLIYFLRIHWRIYGGICCQIGFCFCSLTLASNIKKKSNTERKAALLRWLESFWKWNEKTAVENSKLTGGQLSLSEVFLSYLPGAQLECFSRYEECTLSGPGAGSNLFTTSWEAHLQPRVFPNVPPGVYPLQRFRGVNKSPSGWSHCLIDIQQRQSLCLVKYAALPHPILLDMLYCVSVNLLNPKL